MFTVIKEDSGTNARLGVFKGPRGEFKTPTFFPVATQAAVKGLAPKELEEIGVDGLLVNAYHLFLRPGVEVISRCGGLHRFMNFNKTIITDSGGYQIFSLERLRKVSDAGVEFQSHIDGSRFFLSPEQVIDIQLSLGADVVVPLDECLKYPASYEAAQTACQRTLAWASRSKAFFAHHRREQTLFMGIVQGSTFSDLRQRCLEELLFLGIDGLCIGGLSVGEPADLRYNILSFLHDHCGKDCFRYFMGYGKPEDILEAVSRGIDLFDCVVPTRFARTGTAFSWEGEMVIRNAPFASDTKPIDETCSCYTCRNFSRAYLRHLINVREMLGIQLLTYHNVFWYRNFMERIRQAIAAGTFASLKQSYPGATSYAD